MKQNLKRFASCVAWLAVASGVITVLAGFNLNTLTHVGTLTAFVGLGIAGYRLRGGEPSAIPDAVICYDPMAAHHRAARREGEQKVPLTLPAGALFLASLAWIVIMQLLRHCLVEPVW